MFKKIKEQFEKAFFNKNSNKRKNIHMLLFQHNLLVVVIIFLSSLFLFNYIYNFLIEEQKSSKENLIVHNIIIEIEQCRNLLEEYRISKVPQRKAELLLQQKAILVNIESEINSLEIRYQESPTRYFLNNGILNGKKTIEELHTVLQNKEDENSPDFYKIYYRISSIYDYLYKYLTNQYLLAMVKDNVALMADKEQQLIRLRAVSIIVFFLLLLSYIISTSRTTKKMLGPIDAMVSTAKKIEEGIFEEEVKIIEGPQELVFLEESIENMKKSLRDKLDLIQKNASLEKEIHIREMEQLKTQKELEKAKFKSLQAQINPHFLFNTLNIIQLTALFENADRTNKLIQSLAAIFRYSLEHQDEITIREELFFIEQYLKIQKARFNERLTYSINCGELCKNILIPPLILQPLVENAIIHGIEPKEEGGLVSIDIFKQLNSVIINIKDTGVGIDEDFDVKDSTKSTKGHNIAIYNIKERLKIYFNNNASISFNRLNENGGSCVKIIIPYEVENV